MAYQVDKFNGTFLVSVADGTIDTTTDLRFLGKNYAGYGEVQNENFLHLLENFSNASPPPKVITGQVWFDTANKKLKFYDGTQFRTAGGAETGSSAPSGLSIGDFWFDTSAEQLYAWNGTDYILIGPENAPDTGTSALVSQVVKDTVGVNHSLAKILSGGETIAIISKDAFTLDTDLNPITGFTVIKKGVNLINTPSTGVTSTDHFFWGTASNAAKLGGYNAEDFIRAGSDTLPNGAKFGDAGFFVGDQFDLKIHVENGDEPVLENTYGGPIKIKLKISGSSQDSVIFNEDGIIPAISSQFDLGSTSSKWNFVYSNSFVGPVTGNLTGNVSGNITGNLISSADSSVIINSATKAVTGNFFGLLTGNVVGDLIGTANNALTLNSLTTDTAASASTIALRDASGDLTANRFLGTSTLADRIKIDNSAVDTDPSYRTAKTTSAGNSIAARDSSGNLTAVIFDGTATAARYADLAEKYTTDKEYEPGTVVTVCDHEDHEVEASKYGDRALGVVSENPAFMMNKDLEGGTYIALKGRVPVKVIGAVKKGQRLIAANDGCAVAAVPHANDVFAIALESNNDTGMKIIEAVVL